MFKINNKDTRKTCFYCWLWTCNCRMGNNERNMKKNNFIPCNKIPRFELWHWENELPNTFQLLLLTTVSWTVWIATFLNDKFVLNKYETKTWSKTKASFDHTTKSASKIAKVQVENVTIPSSVSIPVACDSKSSWCSDTWLSKLEISHSERSALFMIIDTDTLFCNLLFTFAQA